MLDRCIVTVGKIVEHVKEGWIDHKGHSIWEPVWPLGSACFCLETKRAESYNGFMTV